MFNRFALLLMLLLVMQLVGCGEPEAPTVPLAPDTVVDKPDSDTIPASEIDDYRRILSVHPELSETVYYDRQTVKRITGLDLVPADSFSEGLSPAYDTGGEFYRFVGYMNTRGEVVVKLPSGTIQEGVSDFSEDRALVYVVLQGDLAFGVINKQGEWVVEPKPGQFDSLGECHDGRIAFEKNERIGFLDHDGKVVIPPIYYGTIVDDAAWKSRFRDGLCLVLTDDDQKFIDTEGKTLVLPDGIFTSDEFFEGLAAVVGQVETLAPPTRYGFINPSGQLAIALQFTEVGHFSEGLCPATLELDVAEPLPQDPAERHSWNYKRAGTPKAWGFIDKTGKFVIEPQFDRVGDFSEGLAQFSQDGKIGYIDRAGKIVVPAQFLQAWDFDRGFAKVVIPGGKLGIYAYINGEGRIVINSGIERTPEW